MFLKANVVLSTLPMVHDVVKYFQQVLFKFVFVMEIPQLVA